MNTWWSSLVICLAASLSAQVGPAAQRRIDPDSLAQWLCLVSQSEDIVKTLGSFPDLRQPKTTTRERNITLGAPSRSYRWTLIDPSYVTVEMGYPVNLAGKGRFGFTVDVMAAGGPIFDLPSDARQWVSRIGLATTGRDGSALVRARRDPIADGLYRFRLEALQSYPIVSVSWDEAADVAPLRRFCNASRPND